MISLRSLALDLAEGLVIFVGGLMVAGITAIALLWWMVG